MNNIRVILRKALLTMTLVASEMGFAANASIPWYVNPTLKARVGVGADAFTAPNLRLSADGDWLGFSAATETGGRIAAFRMADLAALDAADAVTADAGISAATADLGLGSGAFGFLTSGALGAAVAWNGEGIAHALPNGGFTYRAWTRRFKPQTASVRGPAEAVVLNGKGTEAWSAAADGSLVRWTVSGDALKGSLELTKTSETVASGFAAIADFAVYTMKGADYALVGGGTEVALVNLANGTRQTLLSGLASPVASVRMSQTDDFRPRLYVLTEAGDLTVCVFSADALEVDETWTKKFAADDLSALAGAKVAAFDVSADGTTLVLVGAAGGSLAVVRHEPKVWCYTTEDDGLHYITDGNWKLRCWDEYGKVAIGTGWDTANAYANDYIGEYLDFSSGYATNATTGAQMRIMGHRTNALGVTANGGPRVIVFSPNSENVGSYNQFMKDWDTVEEVIIDAANMTRVDAWAGFPSSVRRAVLKLPGLTTLADQALRGEPAWPCGDSDASAWDFSGLKTFGGANLYHTDVRGALNLPVVETVGNSAMEECHYLTEVRMGADAKSVQSIGAKVLRVTDQGGDRAVGRLKKLVLGGVDGFTIGKDAFGGQPLEEVVFTGGVPAFADGFMFTDTAARTMFFAVPRGDAKWAAALAGKVTELSEAERRAIQKANPDRPMPFGVVAADVFHTAHEQYVCWADAAARCKVTVEHDTFFGDEVEVASDLAPASDGSYAAGTTLTLTPKASATGTFRKWYGDVPGGASTDATLSLVVSNDVWILARFTHPWTLTKTDDPKKMLASNGNFTLNCTVRDEANRTLGLGDGDVDGGVRTLYADTDEGEGVLDLGGEVRLEGDATPWKFAKWQGWAYNGSPLTRTKFGKGNVSTLILTDDMGIPEGGTPFGVDGAGEASFKTIVIDMPTRSDNLRHWIWGGAQTKLTRIILQSPNLRFVKFQADADEPVFRNMPLDETKFDWWDLSGLSSLSSKAWSTGGSSHISASGTLRLPSLCVVQQEALAWMPNVEAIELGGLTRETVVTEIGANAFAQNPKLRRLTLHNAANMTVGDSPFYGGATPREIVFTGSGLADDGAAFAALMTEVEAAETKPVVIYVSTRMPGWENVAYIDHNVTDAERAQLPDAKILGVYRGGAEAPLGKALVVKRESPFDPLGLYIRIR